MHMHYVVVFLFLFFIVYNLNNSRFITANCNWTTEIEIKITLVRWKDFFSGTVLVVENYCDKL